MKQTKIIAAAVIILSILGLYLGFFRKEKQEYNSVKVSKENVIQEVSETGVVKTGEEKNLSFKNTGRIERIYVKETDQVKAGDPLVKLETSQLNIQLAESKASLGVANAQLKKLLAGASAEEIKTAETQVSNAQTSLQSKITSLENVRISAEQDIKDAYEDALNVLDDSYLKIYNAFNVADLIQRTYFTSTDQESISVINSKNKISESMNTVKPYVDDAKAVPTQANIDTALSELKKALDSISVSLGIIRENAETSNYKNRVSSTDKSSLDTHRGYINTALTNIANSQQTIASTKITNRTDIDAAESAVSTAQGALREAQDGLSELKAAARKEDVDLYRAKVTQAEAQVNLLRNQIADATLVSPSDGQVMKIIKKTGETVQITEPVVSFLSVNPFQIEADIYEEDVVKVRMGDPVSIKFTAFPDKLFKGKVISIDPAEKLVGGVVYYEVDIDFEGEPPLEIKPGMTADIAIETALKENALAIPGSALKKKNGKIMVDILENGNPKEREIEIGLKGTNDMIEVLSGLAEGENVVVK